MIRRIISMIFKSAKPVVKVESVHAGTGKGDGIKDYPLKENVGKPPFIFNFMLKKLLYQSLKVDWH